MSVTDHVIFVTPTGYIVKLLFVIEKIEQLSTANGAPKATPEAEHTPRSLLTTTSAGQVRIGATVSVIVTIAIQLAELPFPSSTVNIMLFGLDQHM